MAINIDTMSSNIEDFFSESFKDEKVENDFVYLEGENGIKIVGYVGDSSLDKLEIPKQIAGKNVTIIDCKSRDSGRMSSLWCGTIVIPETVKKIESIDEYTEKWISQVEVDSSNIYFIVEDGILFSKDKKKLIHAFYKAEKKYIVPSSVEEICDFAFFDRPLEEIVFSDNLKRIGKHSCSCRGELKAAIIPPNVLYIGDGAFGRAQITITGNDTIIGSQIARNIIIADSCIAYIIEDGLLMNRERTRIIQYIGDQKITEIVIPETVEIIDDKAFGSARNIKKIKLNNGLRKIGEYSFSSTAIKSISIPNSVEELAVTAFSKQQPKTKVTFKKGMEYYRENENALYRCYSNGTEELIEIRNKAITEYVVPDNVVKFKRGVFGGCSKLKELRLNENVEEFDEECCISNVFEETCGISKVYIPASVKKLNMIGRQYGGSGRIKYVISEENPYYFIDDDVLYEVNVDDDYTLLCCQNAKIRRLEINDGTTAIAPFAFSPSYADKCNLLQEVIFPDTLKVIGEYAFAETGLKKIVLPPNLESLWDGAFMSCESLKHIDIPSSVSWIAYNALLGCHELKDITVSENNKNYISKNGILFNKKMSRLLMYPNGKDEKEYVIPEGVKSFGVAFNYTTTLDTLVIPATLDKLNNRSFAQSEISNLVFKGDKTEVDKGAFEDRLTTVPILIHSNPDSYIYKYCQQEDDDDILAVLEDDSLETIQIKMKYNYLIRDGKAVIVKYKGNETIAEIPPVIEGCPVEALEGDVFKKCYSLQKIVIPEGVKRLGAGTLYHPQSLGSLTVPSTVTDIDDNIFADESGNYKDLNFSVLNTVICVKRESYAQKFFSNYHHISGFPLKVETI